MTLLSRKADYALLILSYLHQKQGGGTARAIAEKFGISRPFVANILKELGHHGFVASSRGVKGGYALARPAEAITLAELLESVEAGFRLTVCTAAAGTPAAHDHDHCALEGACTLKGPLATVHNRLFEVLRGITLAGLFGQNGTPTQPSALLSLPLLAESRDPVAVSARA